MDNTDIQEAVMSCQGILDDLRTLGWRLDDRRSNDIDAIDINNIVHGLESLYQIKFDQLWDVINSRGDNE